MERVPKFHCDALWFSHFHKKADLGVLGDLLFRSDGQRNSRGANSQICLQCSVWKDIVGTLGVDPSVFFANLDSRIRRENSTELCLSIQQHKTWGTNLAGNPKRRLFFPPGEANHYARVLQP